MRNMDYRFFFAILLFIIGTVSCQSRVPQARCYTCLYAERQGERPTGLIDCLQPTVANVRSEICAGHCYKIDVEVGETGTQYIQRGCLPNCRNHDEYQVAHYGVGSIHCCGGDLCNSTSLPHINIALFISLFFFLLFKNLV